MRRAVSLFLIFALASIPAATPSVARAQEPRESQAASGEMVVNLAAGKVIIAVLKDGIIAGTVENPIEAGSRLPIPVAVSEAHLGIVLGAVEWIDPSSRTQLARLDLELPQMHAQGSLSGPHLGSPAGSEATDLESIGEGLLTRLNELARDFHSKIETTGNAPFVELILAGYAADYGPEVWRVDYRIHQSEEAVGYWITRVERPSYAQLWPPEKGQPRTLMEFSYPGDDSSLSLLELITRNDPRLQKLTASDAQMAAAARAIVDGQTNKLKTVEAMQFFRAALDATNPRGSRQAIALLQDESGFSWILAPPAEPAAAPGMKEERPNGAPTLRHPSQ